MRPGSATPAHLVLDEDELTRGRPHVGDGLPAVARAIAHPEHEVGERQVGDELPVTDEQVQPLDVVVGQVGPPTQELAQGCHDPSLCEPRTAATAGLSRDRQLGWRLCRR